MHIVPLDLVEDVPNHFPNNLMADIISHCKYCWYLLFTSNKGKNYFLIVFGILFDISPGFDHNVPYFFLFRGSNMPSFLDKKKTPRLLAIRNLNNLKPLHQGSSITSLLLIGTLSLLLTGALFLLLISALFRHSKRILNPSFRCQPAGACYVMGNVSNREC